MRVVIDSNVIIAANRRETTASIQCSAACARRLLDAIENDLILEDTADLIWAEYKRAANFSGQPGAGDRFFELFARNRWTPSRVKRVDIGTNDEDVADRIPPGLRTFDRSDQKWIATYIHGDGDVLYNALDSDWSESAEAISDEGIKVVEPADRISGCDQNDLRRPATSIGLGARAA